jgi:Uma2 family endonuclease
MTSLGRARPMTVATDRRMTLKEFLTYDDGTNTRYELVDGVLVAMGTESTGNVQIAMLLIEAFLQLVGRKRVGIKQKIEVRSHYASARDVDLIIHSDESRAAIRGRSEACLFLGEPNPLIVIEVVSPGAESTDNYQRDYVQKPHEFAARGIAEFWQIDLHRSWVKIGMLIDGAYEFKTFMGQEFIVSPTFLDLKLTAAEILEADD